jgi:hypothetical protein
MQKDTWGKDPVMTKDSSGVSTSQGMPKAVAEHLTPEERGKDPLWASEGAQP